ncbi:MAG: methionine synthase [Planctomycetes bacterium]|nr:methionine synthase [Planctomycetota bacterium]
MGSSLQKFELAPEDFDGREGCNEILNLTRPEVVRAVHDGFLDAGVDAVETNTFGAFRLVLDEYGLGERVREINRAAARIAREACEAHAKPDRPRFVVGSVGPGTKMPSLGQISFQALHGMYVEQVRGLVEGGVDAVLVETCFDPLQAKAGLVAALDVFRETGHRLPLLVQVTIESFGTMLVGTEIGAALATLSAYPVDAIGTNCATGPREMVEHVRYLCRHSPRPVSCQPNAGIPDTVGGKARYPLAPEELADHHELFVREFGVSIVGGCCGTTPEHLAAVVRRLWGARPKERVPEVLPSASSLFQRVGFRQDPRPLIVGERTNTNGSKKFRELLLAGDLDGMVGVAKAQVAEGAHMLDVCVAYVGRDEPADMKRLVERLAKEVKVPLLLDTTEVAVLEEVLPLVGGRCVINSINLEDGEGKLRRVVELAGRYGAALVALTIDEEGMAKTAERKLAVARRIHDIVVGEYGFAGADLLFDPLTFTIATGNEADRRHAIETLEGIRRIKKAIPEAHTILGLSNVSFGLSPATRSVLNSVFLHEALERGLDAAIVHWGGIVPFYKTPERHRDICRRLIHDRREDGRDPLRELLAEFAGPGGEGVFSRAAPASRAGLPVEERLFTQIVEGDREDLVKNLDLALGKWPPLAIVNRHLLPAMKKVGDLMAAGEMQLPFVLQSAEVMKSAIEHLEPLMEKAEGYQKGVVVLATVRGDVHDIGKNLVDIILTNNGYRVVNLGTKQPLERMLSAAEEHRADAIGMSGLLVKSTVVMKENLEEMNRRGIRLPVILGGAALTRRYVEEELRRIYKGPLWYGEDAFEGLSIVAGICEGRRAGARELAAPAARPKLARASGAACGVPANNSARSASLSTAGCRSDVSTQADIPQPPFWGSRVVTGIDLSEVYRYVNKIALYRNQWQYRRGKRSREEYARFVEGTVEPVFEMWCRACKEEGILQPRVVYGYFPCRSDGDELVVYDEDARTERARFRFPRQPGRKHLCIADFFAGPDSGRTDVVAFHLVTMGDRATPRALALKEEGRYADYLHLHGFGVEAAEALAEYWHRRIREELGIAGGDAPRIQDLFKQGYRGSRFSFGYPACPNLEDQRILFELLEAERIGVSLSEEFQLHPEQSTSALIAHHPEARYFVL